MEDKWDIDRYSVKMQVLVWVEATTLIGGHRSPVSPVSPSRVMGQGNGDATRSAMLTTATPVPTTPKR